MILALRGTSDLADDNSVCALDDVKASLQFGTRQAVPLGVWGYLALTRDSGPAELKGLTICTARSMFWLSAVLRCGSWSRWGLLSFGGGLIAPRVLCVAWLKEPGVVEG